MQLSTITVPVLFALIAVGFSAGYPSVLTSSVDNDEYIIPQSRNFFQQLVINQIVNILPVNIREKINDAAATFNLTRNEFLIKCLRELQAFQDYSKIDFITGIQKTIKFVDENLTREQQKELEQFEKQGIAVIKLMFSNQLKSGALNKIYDLLVKVVRQKIDGVTFVDELPKLVEEILSQHA